MSKKKKSIDKLGAAIAEHEKNNNVPTSAVQQLVEAFLSIGNPVKRAKKIAEIKSRASELNAMLCENSDLLTAEVEQALLRAATGYTVTEHKVKLVNGMKTVEKVEKHIQPSQAAIEFYLTNKKPEAYSRTGGSRSGSEDRVSEILEALKNA